MRLVPLWRGRLGAKCVYVCVLPVCNGFLVAVAEMAFPWAGHKAESEEAKGG